MNLDDPIFLADMMLRHKTGRLNDEEQKALDGRLKNDPALRRMLEDLANKKLISRELALMASFRTPGSIGGRKRPLLPVKRWLPLAGLAAGLLLAGTLAFLFWFPKKRSFAVIGHLTMPKTEPVKLRLSSGRELTLDTLTSYTEQGLQVQNKAGQLQVLTPAKDAEPQTAALNTLEVPFRNRYQLLLPDGSKVYLNAGSVLKFPPAFPATERRIHLEGEGFVEVAQLSGKPFMVETQRMLVRVLGTSFNIRSHDGERESVLYLKEGRVSVEGRSGESLIMNAGQGLRYDQQTGHMRRVPLDGEEELAWRKGNFMFRDQFLKAIMQQLSHYYGIDIRIEDKALETVLLSGEMPMYADPTDAFRKFEKLGGLTFGLDGSRIAVRKKERTE